MTVELFGLARALAGCACTELAIAEPATLGTLVRALGEKHPELIGSVIAVGGETFVPPNYLLLDGRRGVDRMEPIATADRPCVLFLASGG